MKAEIIMIGTELLLGQIVDTNAAYLAQKLAETGFNLYHKTTVGDNDVRITESIQNALQRSDVVITSGGLGPTVDDKTREAVASKLGFSNEDVERCVSESSEEFFVNMRDDISISIDTYKEIGRMLDEYCGINDAPPISNIINILQESQGAINHIGKYKIPTDDTGEVSAEESGEASNTAGEPTSQIIQASGPIKTRADAFKKLIEISEFFRKTEPHSPISYIIERAVKWGDMPLDDLMKELIPDSSARDFYGSLTGVKTEDEY